MAIERYHPLFVEDLSEACRYYDGISDTLGQRFRQRVREMVTVIAERPLSYARIGGGFRGGLVRGFPYVDVFEVDRVALTIYGIRLAASDRGDWFARTMLG